MIGIIGGGNMAEAIIAGTKEKDKIIVSDKRKDRLEYLKKNYGVKTTLDNKEVCSLARTIILAVKPQDMRTLFSEIGDCIGKEHLLVSIAAGIGIDYLSEKTGTRRIIRVMPNTPALVGQAMTVLSPSEEVNSQEIQQIIEIFRGIGDVMVLPESKMDAVTALSGSGPAFVALFVESLTEAGVKEGLTYDDALRLTLQTIKGTIGLFETGRSASEIKRMVTSPGGTTAEGLYRMERGAFKGTVIEAITAATDKSRMLGR